MRTEEYKQKMREMMSGERHPMFGKTQSEETKRKISESHLGKTVSNETKRKLSESHLGKTVSNETKRKISNTLLGKIVSNETKRKISESHLGKTQSGETKQKISKFRCGKTQSDETKQKIREAQIGGFCIQNIIYYDEERYCVVWGPDLWKRIDEYQDNRSIISGKTKEDNGSRALSRHHVYWQKKSCCKDDKDGLGYYAMINIGTRGQPEMYKYYIRGDLNKFVLLTSDEHRIIAGNKKLGTTKLTWIKVLEDLIETKLGGKCYYTKEEYAELFLNDGRFTGEGRKVGHGKLSDEQIDIIKKATGFEPDIKN